MQEPMDNMLEARDEPIPSDVEHNRSHLLALVEAYKGAPVGVKFAELLEDFDRCHYGEPNDNEMQG